jgi:hypothetical protein
MMKAEKQLTGNPIKVHSLKKQMREKRAEFLTI